jgi:hypothetical protein
VIGGAIAALVGVAAFGAWLMTTSSSSKKSLAAAKATPATSPASASSMAPTSAPESTITFPPGMVLKDRVIPSYDEKSFTQAIEHAGFKAQLQRGADAPGYKLTSVRAQKAPCGGSAQLFEVTPSQAEQTASAMRSAVDPTYVVVLDPPRVVMVAMDTLEGGANAECTGELVEALTSKR